MTCCNQHPRTDEAAFAELLRERVYACEASPADISRNSWIDAGYLSKMFSGQKTHPSRDVVIRLAAFGLRLGMEDTDELLMAATFRPLVPAYYWK